MKSLTLIETNSIRQEIDCIKNLKNLYNNKRVIICCSDSSWMKRFQGVIDRKHQRALEILSAMEDPTIPLKNISFNQEFLKARHSLQTWHNIHMKLLGSEPQNVCYQDAIYIEEYALFARSILFPTVVETKDFWSFKDLLILKDTLILIPQMNHGWEGDNLKKMDWIESIILENDVVLTRVSQLPPSSLWIYYTKTVKPIPYFEDSIKTCGDQSKPYVCPPFRPQKLSISDISNLLFDPYGFYVKHILCLKPYEEESLKLKKGKLIHEICYQVFKNQTIAKDDFLNMFHQLISKYFKDFERGYKIFLEIEFLNTVNFLMDQPLSSSLLEHILYLQMSGLTITGRADRIDIDGNFMRIIDYKTSAPPTKKSLINGEKPQLLIEAFMLLQNPPKPFKEISLEIWNLCGKSSKRVCQAISIASLDHAMNKFKNFLEFYKIRPFTITDDTKFPHLARNTP